LTTCGENGERFRPRGRDPVARLAHIVQSKRNAGRQKDLNFLITHEQALRDLLRRDED
jgi:hypothetical protein